MKSGCLGVIRQVITLIFFPSIRSWINKKANNQEYSMHSTLGTQSSKQMTIYVYFKKKNLNKVVNETLNNSLNWLLLFQNSHGSTNHSRRQYVPQAAFLLRPIRTRKSNVDTNEEALKHTRKIKSWTFKTRANVMYPVAFQGLRKSKFHIMKLLFVLRQFKVIHVVTNITFALRRQKNQHKLCSEY